MNIEPYPAWVDDAARSILQAFSNMAPSNWSPDGFAVFRLLQGTFLKKLKTAIDILKERNVPLSEVAKCFRSPSGFRCASYFTILEYFYLEQKDKEEFKEVIEYLMSVLYVVMQEDAWAEHKSIVHSPQLVAAMLKDFDWQKGTPEIAQELGKLYNSAFSLVYALYGDYFPQDACDIYGPYDASEVYGEDTILLIKHFSKIYPKELWSTLANTKCDDLKIYQVYKDVSFRCEFSGTHSLYEGDLRNGLVAWAVEKDGVFITNTEEIKTLRNYLAESAQTQAAVRDGMTKEDLKNKIAEWLCYQYVSFFALAEMDWRPTSEMKSMLEGKEIPDILTIDSMPPYDEFVSNPEYEIYWVKDLYSS